MKRKAVGVLTAVMLTSLTGCSSQAQATNVTENAVIESTAIEETGSIPESEVELVYTEYEDLFLADNYKQAGKEKLETVDRDSITKTYEKYTLSDTTDLYNMEGTWVGYSKPNVDVFLFGENDKWAEVSFLSTVLYIPKERFDMIASLVAEEPETEEVLLAEVEEPAPKQETTPTQPKTETSAPVASEPAVATESVATEKPATTQSVVVEPETPVVDNTKYTPEEAIAVYRSIMEANGIEWDPELKNGGSWGTGWISLTKGETEQAGNAGVSSFSKGDSVGNSWDCYYLEVTGSDENAVYATLWHP